MEINHGFAGMRQTSGGHEQHVQIDEKGHNSK